MDSSLALLGNLFGFTQLSHRDNWECSLYHYGTHSSTCGAYEIIFPYNASAEARVYCESLRADCSAYSLIAFLALGTQKEKCNLYT
jgi:hypothetical protein